MKITVFTLSFLYRTYFIENNKAVGLKFSNWQIL